MQTHFISKVQGGQTQGTRLQQSRAALGVGQLRGQHTWMPSQLHLVPCCFSTDVSPSPILSPDALTTLLPKAGGLDIGDDTSRSTSPSPAALPGTSKALRSHAAQLPRPWGKLKCTRALRRFVAFSFFARQLGHKLSYELKACPENQLGLESRANSVITELIPVNLCLTRTAHGITEWLELHTGFWSQDKTLL